LQSERIRGLRKANEKYGKNIFSLKICSSTFRVKILIERERGKKKEKCLCESEYENEMIRYNL
jgi:hypothetical protein